MHVNIDHARQDMSAGCVDGLPSLGRHRSPHDADDPALLNEDVGRDCSGRRGYLAPADAQLDTHGATSRFST